MRFRLLGLCTAILALSGLACEAKFVGGAPNPPSGNKDGVLCAIGNTRCESNMVYACKKDSMGAANWIQQKICSTQQLCKHTGGAATCVDLASCTDKKKNQDETDTDCGGASCPACVDGKQCKKDTDCVNKACVNGICQPCKANSHSCLGNFLRQCKSDNSGWTTVATCDPKKYEKCKPDLKICERLKATGSPTPTGKYFLYSSFLTGTTAFKGGYDVDGYKDLIYVNRSKQLDVYKVELVDTDADGKMEPNQHPEYKKNTGPIEQRKLTFIKTYPNVVLGQPSVAEVYALKDRIYFLKLAGAASNIYEYIFATGVTNMLVKGNIRVSCIGYDEAKNQWYGAYNSSIRVVYSYWPKGNGYSAEFWYPDLAGSHLDGIEVITDPNTKRSYVYASDMTSDFLAQYYKDSKTGKWVQNNIFEYKETQNQYVEGMGFGAFQHFWMTSGKMLYEVGGGDLQKYVQEPIK